MCWNTESHLGTVSLQTLWDKTTNLVIKSCVVWAASCLIKKSSFNTVPNLKDDTEIKCVFFPPHAKWMCVPGRLTMNLSHDRKNHSFPYPDEKPASANEQWEEQSSKWSVHMPGVHRQSFGMWGEKSWTSVIYVHCHMPSKFAFVSFIMYMLVQPMHVI